MVHLKNLRCTRFNIFLIHVLTVTVLVQITKTVATCKTPDDRDGNCIMISECPRLNQLLTRRPASTSDLVFLMNSACGFEGAVPKVCCLVEPSNIQNSTTRIRSTSFDFQATVHDLLPNTDECGLYNPYRTFGREHPDLYEFPWTVLLEYETKQGKRNFFCGGVLISKRYILTAGNCITQFTERRTGKLISVRLGEYNLATDPDCVDYGFGEECTNPSVNIAVEEIIPHDNFSRSTSYDDIGLVRLKQEVEFSDFIQPICLPSTNFHPNYVGKKLFEAGWGKSRSGANSEVKLKDLILVRNNSACLVNIEISENQLCAGGEENRILCKGDAGGSLMSIGVNKGKKITRWNAIGVSSMGPGHDCVGNESLIIYTRVSSYIPWILSKLKE